MTIRDFRSLESDRVSNGEFELFTANPSRDNVRRNYEDNPLPYNVPKRVLSLGLTLAEPVFEADANQDPENILNDFAHAELRFEKDQGRTTVLKSHLKQFYTSENTRLRYAAFDDGTNSGNTKVYVAAVYHLTRVHNAPIILQPDERFNFVLEFDETSAFPATANATNEIGAFIQLARPPISDTV